MATKCARGKVPPTIAKFFHSLPHVNFNFENISSTFEPTDIEYQQNFWLYSAVPVLCGGVLSLILIIIFLTFCCWWCRKLRKKQISKRKTKNKCAACLALLIWLFSLICCGSIIAGFVFNDDVENGVKNVTMAIKNVSDTFDNIQNEVSGVQNNLLDIRSSIRRLIDDSPDIPDEVREILEEIQETVLSIIQALRGVKKQQTPDVDNYIKTGEYYRWWAAFGILGLGILTCLFAGYSTIRNSRCGFVMAILIGCVAFLLEWVLLGSHLGASIAMSDLCINPRKTIDFYTSQSSLVVKGIVNYYVDCKPHSEHPYEQYVNESLSFAQDGEVLFKELEKRWPTKQSEIQKVVKNFNRTKTDLMGLQDELKCAGFQQQYKKAQCAVCFPVVEGLSKLLLISIILVVFLALILLFIIPMCKRIHRQKRTGNAVGSMLSTGDPSLETEYHSVTSDDESLPLIPSDPPPPYEAVARSVDYQFHSCQEDRNPVNSFTQPEENQPNNMAPPPPRGEIVSNPNRVTTMAF